MERRRDGLTAMAAAEPPLSQVVQDGIGRRFPGTSGPLVLDSWPVATER